MPRRFRRPYRGPISRKGKKSQDFRDRMPPGSILVGNDSRKKKERWLTSGVHLAATTREKKEGRGLGRPVSPTEPKRGRGKRRARPAGLGEEGGTWARERDGLGRQKREEGCLYFFPFPFFYSKTYFQIYLKITLKYF